MDSRRYLTMCSWPPLAMAVGMEWLEVAAPYSVWELGFSLLMWRELTYELKNALLQNNIEKWKPGAIIPYARNPFWLLWFMKWGGWRLQIMSGNWEAAFGVEGVNFLSE